VKHTSLLPLLILVLVTPACKPPGAKAVVLKDAAPPALEDGWQPVAIEGVEFTFALPPEWMFAKLDKTGLEQQVKAMNENAWDMLGQKKAEVNFDTAQAVVGLYESPISDFMSSNRMVTQVVIAIREDLSKALGIKDAAARWRDTVKVEGATDEPKEGAIELPVGPAATISSAALIMGFIEKQTVVCLVDGNVAYTFIFHEEASGEAKAAPVQAIMATFRPGR
jgi:hypothetical protein